MNGFLLLFLRGYFGKDHYFLRGRGVKQVFLYKEEKQFCTAKAAKNISAGGATGKKIKQILSAITSLIFDEH